MVTAVDDLIDMAQDDVLGHPWWARSGDLFERTGAELAVGEDRHAGPVVGCRGRLEASAGHGRWAAVAPGDLDDARSICGPADDRIAVVVGVDAVGDVTYEQLSDSSMPIRVLQWVRAVKRS